MRYGKAVLLVYLLALHTALVVLLVESPQVRAAVERTIFTPKPTPAALMPAVSQTYFYREMLAMQMRLDPSVPDNAVVFLGDSIIQSFHVQNAAPNTVNFGIGGDSTEGVLARINKYDSLRRARVLVLAVGINDLVRYEDAEIERNYQAILASVPERPRIVCSAIFPAAASARKLPLDRIRRLNNSLRSYCEAMPKGRCVFLDSGPRVATAAGYLDPRFEVGDGLHPNTAAYALWAEDLRGVLAGMP